MDTPLEIIQGANAGNATTAEDSKTDNTYEFYISMFCSAQLSLGNLRRLSRKRLPSTRRRYVRKR